MAGGRGDGKVMVGLSYSPLPCTRSKERRNSRFGCSVRCRCLPRRPSLPPTKSFDGDGSKGAPYQAAVDRARGKRRWISTAPGRSDQDMKYIGFCVCVGRAKKGSCSCASCMQNGVETASPFHLHATSSPLTMGIGQRGVCGVRIWSL
jgi:hypothetical protein